MKTFLPLQNYLILIKNEEKEYDIKIFLLQSSKFRGIISNFSKKKKTFNFLSFARKFNIKAQTIFSINFHVFIRLQIILFSWDRNSHLLIV